MFFRNHSGSPGELQAHQNTYNAKGKDKHMSRIINLRNLILKAKHAYYYSGKPIMSDAEYDALEDELRTLAPDDPVLATRDAFTRLVDDAIAEVVDFMIIAGDLYYGGWKDYSSRHFFCCEMGRLHKTGTNSVERPSQHNTGIDDE